MIPLKDGTETSDPRLNRLVQFDEKSRQYPVMATLGGLKPRSYTWAGGPVLDQGPDGACVGFAMTHELAARPAVVKGRGPSFAKEKVYWEAQKIDAWPGGSYPGASPRYEGTSVLAGIKMMQKMGYIKEYRWAFGLDDLVMAVGYKGPAVLGIPWYEGMYTPGHCGYIHIGGKMVGGHAILCRGVSVKNRTFLLQNSWGPNWGKNGTALISWEDMDRLLHERGEAVIPTIRTKKR